MEYDGIWLVRRLGLGMGIGWGFMIVWHESITAQGVMCCHYTAKNAEPAAQQDWTMFCCPRPTLFTLVNNIEHVVEPESGVTILFNIVDNCEQCGQQSIVQPCFHQYCINLCVFFQLPMHPLNYPRMLLCLMRVWEYFTLSNARWFYSSSGECCHSMGPFMWQWILMRPTSACYARVFYSVSLSNARRFYSSSGKCSHSMG